MARKYSRDNRGRFASGGGGSTARGGRLRTAGGNKRATQTMKAQGAGGAGVMKGAVKRDLGAMAKVGKPAAAPAKTAPTGGNKIAASPRRFNAAERAYAEISQQPSKFRSDAQVRAEMQRRGFLKGKDTQGDLINIARAARMKAGIEGNWGMSSKDKRAALTKRAGVSKPAKAPRGKSK